MSEPPNNLDAEAFLLGAMLLKDEVIDAVSESVIPSDFYRPAHGIIYSAMVELRNAGEPIDALTVVNAIQERGLMDRVGDPSIFIDLTANVPSINHARSYARTVLDFALRRRMIALAQETILKSHDLTNNPEALLDEYQAASIALGSSVIDREPDDHDVNEFTSAAHAKGVVGEWVVPKLVRRGHKVMIVGGEGSGKSWLLRYIAICAAHGIRPFRHTKVNPVRTLIVDAENPEDALYESFMAILKGVTNFGPHSDAVSRIWWRPQGINLRNRADLAEFENVLRVRRPDFVCMGPLYSLYANNPKEPWETGAIEVQKILKQLVVRYDLALMIEDHAPQSDNQGNRNWRPYGSSMWLRWPDIGIGMKPIGESGTGFELIRWRGDRVPTDWPKFIERGSSTGSPWPFEGRWE